MHYTLLTPTDYLRGDAHPTAEYRDGCGVELSFKGEGRDTEFDIGMSADEARLLSLKLMRLADMADPIPVREDC
ncbi:hypothetical protein [Streptomyces sp. NPDC101393]|uniref:hypothetical protein n=1 Tax=Streptomyces sp. NPDC101393 TaxID=3366141 RepID=UPI00380F6D78